MDKNDVNELKELIIASQVVCISLTTFWGLTNYYGDNKENKIYFDIALLTTSLVTSITLYRI